MADWIQSRAGPIIRIRIVGDVHAEDAAAAADRLAKEVAAAEAPIHLVIDLLEMSGYEISARTAWSDRLREMRPKISSMTWVIEKASQRIVARAVGLYTGIATSVADRRSDAAA